MTACRPLAAVLAALLVCQMPAAAQDEGARSLFDDPTIESVSLGELRSDSATLRVTAAVVARTDVTLESLEFERLTVEGVDLAVPPLPGPLRLREGETLRLPPFVATVGFDALPSLDALRTLLGAGTARVDGAIRGRVAFTLWQRLATLKRGGWVIVPFEGTVQLTDERGPLERLALTAALTAAGGLWATGRAMRNAAGAARSEGQPAPGVPRLAAVVTTFSIRAKDGTLASRDYIGAGIRVDERHVLAAAEAAEPWRFDAALAEQIARGEQRVVRDSVVTMVHEGVSAPAPSLQADPRRPTERRVSGGSQTGISPTTRRLFPLRLRDRDDNVAVFRLPPGPAALPLPATQASTTDGWQPATIGVLHRSADGIRVERRQVPVRWNGRRYDLRHAATPSSFGSPIWSVDGALLGMVQDATSGAGVDALFREAGIRLPQVEPPSRGATD